ncbi:MAG: tetratricopeptide repeat protein, partial [Gemmatimonadota bacterium]
MDTEDRIMEKIAGLTAWAQRNSRVATLSVLLLVGAGVAGLVYMDYRSDLENQAAVRLDEIRMGMRGTPPAQIRQQLAGYIEQFSATRTADQARILLAEMELERDSADAAVRLLEPVVELDGGPLGYNAGWLRAVAEEQCGDRDAAAEWYERLADAAPHEYQRRRALAARARLHEYAGEYGEAE